MKPSHLLCLAFVVALTACQSMNSALTPSVRESTDAFDGGKVVTQPPVGATASLGESVQTLGFEWTSAEPDRVFLTAGVYGARNIFGLAFNVSGRVIQASEASLTTNFGQVSTRRFSVSYSDFEAIATAPVVKMKVSGANDHGVSTFGTSTAAVVNLKFPSFIQKIRNFRKEL